MPSFLNTQSAENVNDFKICFIILLFDHHCALLLLPQARVLSNTHKYCNIYVNFVGINVLSYIDY